MKGPVKTILVVDDEPDAIELVEFNLRAAGYGVIAAEDGEEAIRKAREGLPDLIVLDVMLPEVDGMAACRTLKNDPITSDIPVIMLTAKAAEIDRVLGLELGADDYVIKPFSPKELEARIRAVLRRSDKVQLSSTNANPGIVQFNFLKIDCHECLPIGILVSTFLMKKFLRQKERDCFLAKNNLLIT